MAIWLNTHHRKGLSLLLSLSALKCVQNVAGKWLILASISLCVEACGGGVVGCGGGVVVCGGV